MKIYPLPLSLSCAVLGAALCQTAFASAPVAPLPNEALTPKAVPQKITIGEQIKVSRALLSAKATRSFAGGHSLKQTIRHPGAHYIKLHFRQVQWPEGAVLVVRSPNNQERYEYTATQLNQATFNQDIGDAGNWQFSAMSVTGDQAVVEWQWPAGVTHVPEQLAEIDSYFVGKKDPVGEIMPMSTCGVNERRDVQCWANSHPVEFERSRPVARLLIGGGSLCTGWRVGSDNRVFTNNHCVASTSEVTATEFWFNYQNTSCGGNTRDTVVKVTGASLLKTDSTLDYSLVSLNNFANISSFGYFGLDVRDASQGERIYIPQHGSGNPKELAIVSDQDANGLCQVNKASTSGNASNTDIGYYCDTIGGSSGSPVLAAATNKVIALHHLGGCTNSGAKISLIWPQVASFFNNVIPEGDNGPATVPVARFTVNCTNLSCQFDASTSTGGASGLTQYQWQFGDGATGSGSQASYQYPAAGSYTVRLTVSNSQGQQASTEQQVQLTDGSDSRALSSGVPRSNLSGSQGSTQFFYIDAQNGVDVTINGGTGDADLYVRKDAEPTTSVYDCRPYKNANNESCTVNKGAGRYWIMLRGYRAYSGVTLVATSR